MADPKKENGHLPARPVAAGAAGVLFDPLGGWLSDLVRRVRAGGFGLVYASSIAVFGGSTQFMKARRWN